MSKNSIDSIVKFLSWLDYYDVVKEGSYEFYDGVYDVHVYADITPDGVVFTNNYTDNSFLVNFDDASLDFESLHEDVYDDWVDAFSY